MMQASEHSNTDAVQYPTKPWNWDAPIWHNLNPKQSQSGSTVVVTNGTGPAAAAAVNGNGHHPHAHPNTNANSTDQDEPPPSIAQLESELPFVDQDQIPLGEILSRVVQDVYAELVTLADTLPSSSDAARKRMLADFVVKHKKQVVKLYAVVKWAKDARDIQLCMNIVSFLLEVNNQFHQVTNALETIKLSLAAAKLRNHDLLTSLDVLTTGTYQRLPTGIKRAFIPKPELDKHEILQTLNEYDHLIRYRLKASEIIPIEMRRYHVSQAQAHFHVPGLFRVSLSLRGSESRDAWFLVNVEFDIKIGDDTGVIEFPRVPTGITKQFIVDEADTRLALYSFLEETGQNQLQPQPETEPTAADEKGTEKEGKEQQKDKDQAAAPPPAAVVPVSPPVPKLPSHVVDAPLVRLYNFLQMLSLSYQLEILHYQAQRMQSLGWNDFLKVSFAKDRKSMTVSYWTRSPPAVRNPNAQPAQVRGKIPLLGGTIVIAIEEMGVSDTSAKSKSMTAATGAGAFGGLNRSVSQSVPRGPQSQSQISLGTPSGTPPPPSLAFSASGAGTGIGAGTETMASSSSSPSYGGVTVQHPSGRSHVERVLHELSVLGKMRRRAAAGGQTADANANANANPSASANANATTSTSVNVNVNMKDNVSSPRPRKDSIRAGTPRLRRDSASTPRPSGGASQSTQLQTQSSFMSMSGSGSGLTSASASAPHLPLPQLSDDVERLYLSVKWTPEPNAFGFSTNPVEWVCKVDVDASNLDFQALLMKVLRRHSEAVLKVLRKQLVEGPHRNVFSEDEVVLGIERDSTPTLSMHLCASEQMIVTIDPRTGKFSLRDMGDLASAGRGPRFAYFSERINENPVVMLSAVVTLRYNTIVENVEQKATALGLQTSRSKGLSREEMAKFGSSARAFLFIQLHHFRSHYLVLIVAEEDFKYALVSLKEASNVAVVYVDDIAWLDVKRVRGHVRIGVIATEVATSSGPGAGGAGTKRKAGEEIGRDVREKSFDLKSPVIKELYAYCCARVAYKSVEWQLKTRGIPYAIIPTAWSLTPTPTNAADGLGGLGFGMGTVPHAAAAANGVQNGNQGQGQGQQADLARAIHSSLASSVPALCVQSKDILSGVPAAEAAMRNIRIVCINWWSTERRCQVVTCVKLKYVQPPVGVDKASAATVIRPSRSVMYDTREAIVSFLSDDVETCVDEFLDGWARVSTIVVIAREVSQMAKAKKWDDVRLLSFDLQTVEFTYMTGYALSISCTHHQQATGGSYCLQFSRVLSTENGSSDEPISRRRARGVTLHDEAAPFLRPLLSNGRLAQSLTEIVGMLRDTLPMALELEKLTRWRKERERDGDSDGDDNMDWDAPNDVEAELFRGIGVDVYPKAFAWYRVLFGDLRHALDFRLMTSKRVIIMDASQSLFDPSSSPVKSTTSSPRKNKEAETATTNTATTTSSDLHTIGTLEPIPDFKNILTQVAQNARVEGWPESLNPYGIALVDNGVVCSSNAAGKVGLSVFMKVCEKLGLGLGRGGGVSVKLEDGLEQRTL